MSDDGLRKIKIGEETFTVPEKMAEALEKQQKEHQETMKKTGIEVKSLRERIDQLGTVSPDQGFRQIKDDEADDDLEILASPKKYFDKRLEAFGEKLTTSIVEKIQGETSKKAKITEFWSEFYSKNKDLKDYDLIVKAVLQRDMAQIGDMKQSEAISELSERVRKEILKINPSSANNEEEIVLEGATSPFSMPTREQSTEDKGKQSLSSIVKKTRAKKYNASN